MFPHRKTTPDDSFRLDWLSESFAISEDSSSRILFAGTGPDGATIILREVERGPTFRVMPCGSNGGFDFRRSRQVRFLLDSGRRFVIY
jgi:hypothetical protein